MRTGHGLGKQKSGQECQDKWKREGSIKNWRPTFTEQQKLNGRSINQKKNNCKNMAGGLSTSLGTAMLHWAAMRRNMLKEKIEWQKREAASPIREEVMEIALRNCPSINKDIIQKRRQDSQQTGEITQNRALRWEAVFLWLESLWWGLTDLPLQEVQKKVSIKSARNKHEHWNFQRNRGNIQTLITFHAGTHPRFQMEQSKGIIPN